AASPVASCRSRPAAAAPSAGAPVFSAARIREPILKEGTRRAAYNRREAAGRSRALFLPNYNANRRPLKRQANPLADARWRQDQAQLISHLAASRCISRKYSSVRGLSAWAAPPPYGYGYGYGYGRL